jgi:hypothetical protein
MWIEEIITRHEDWQRISWISIGAQPKRGGSASLDVRRKDKNLILKIIPSFEMLHRALHLPESLPLFQGTRNEQTVCNFECPELCPLTWKIWTGFMWIRTGSIGGLLYHGIKTVDSIKSEREGDFLTRWGTTTFSVFLHEVGRNNYIIMLQAFIII